MQKDISLSRRSLLAAGATGAAVAAASAAEAASFGNPDEPAEGAVNVVNPKALSDPGPQDPNLANNQPAFLNPPPTDVNGMPQFWASFNLAPKRIQNGGWARQITQNDFRISTTISGVNMRLGPGGVRELHWHQQAEWAIVTYGNCRVTILDENGRPEVADVKEGDLWYFPAAAPFVTGVGSRWLRVCPRFRQRRLIRIQHPVVDRLDRHTPPEVLAKNFGVPVEAFKKIPVHNKWIYQTDTAAPPLATVEAQIAAAAGKPPNPYVFRLADMKPSRETKSGTIRIGRQHQLPCFENHCRDDGQD
jgi:oxalate decarboxylase